MSSGVGTQFTASLNPGQTQTWFTWGWDPNYLLIWSVRPTNSPAQVRLDRVQISYDQFGATYNLTISNTGTWPASFEAKYYFKTVIPEANWRSLGPNHLSGCVIQVIVDPNNSDRLFGVAQGGGLWRLDSINAYPAANWTPLSDSHASLSGYGVAVAPTNSSIVYLAEGGNLLRSTDGGNSWNSVANSLWIDQGPWSHSARKVAIDPANADRIFVASNTGLSRSVDGAVTWKQVIAGDVTDVAIDPGDSSIIYAAQRAVGIVKSSDGGTTWTARLAIAGFQNVKVGLGRQGPPSTRTVVAKFDQQVFVNNDAGIGAWTSSTLPTDPAGETQYEWNCAVAVDPFNNGVILAGTQELCRSQDGGKSWSTVASYYHPHEDQQSIAFDNSNPGVVYLSNDGGVWRSTDDGQTWTSGSSWPWNDIFTKNDLNFGLNTSLFYRVGVGGNSLAGPVSVGPAHHQGLLASRVVKSQEWQEIQGHSWESANTYTFGNQQGAFYLTQGADLWRQIFPTTGGPNDLVQVLPGAASAGQPGIAMDNTLGSMTLFVGDGAGILHYAQNPSITPILWSTVPGISLGERIVSIAFAPATPGMAYFLSQSGKVYRNRNVSSPANWVNMNSNLNLPGPVQMAVGLLDSSRLFAISSNGFATSDDGGKTWQVAPKVTPANLGTSSFQSLQVDNSLPHTLYIAGNPGVFVSKDAGSTWAQFNDGLPNASAGWLQWFGSYLYVATWGRGLWKRQPFAQYGDDNVNINTQFVGTLSPGQGQNYFTWGWPQNWFVVWSVRPTTDGGEFSLDVLDVELEPSGITYHLTITNTSSQQASFEAKYGFVSF
jgi:photosystem II stability/assembly factor-like uncharacterized protein